MHREDLYWTCIPLTQQSVHQGNPQKAGHSNEKKGSKIIRQQWTYTKGKHQKQLKEESDNSKNQEILQSNVDQLQHQVGCTGK